MCGSSMLDFGDGFRMCGIVGLVDLKSSVNQRIIRVAADLLYKRGPDDTKIWVEQNIKSSYQYLKGEKVEELIEGEMEFPASTPNKIQTGR